MSAKKTQAESDIDNEVYQLVWAVSKGAKAPHDAFLRIVELLDLERSATQHQQDRAEAFWRTLAGRVEVCEQLIVERDDLRAQRDLAIADCRKYCEAAVRLSAGVAPLPTLLPHESKLASLLLDEAASEFSNHSCNDLELENTDENWAMVVEMSDEPRARPALGRKLFTYDFLAMRYLAKKLAGE